VDFEDSKLAYEIKPFNVLIGSRGFSMAMIMLGVDIKLEK
jgi:hypothetical protein